jgi:hypothetical protein
MLREFGYILADISLIILHFAADTLILSLYTVSKGKTVYNDTQLPTQGKELPAAVCLPQNFSCSSPADTDAVQMRLSSFAFDTTH